MPFQTLERFQSTLPLRGVTQGVLDSLDWVAISIHTPLAGSDDTAGPRRQQDGFISIHTPLAGSDAVCVLVRCSCFISIHTPLAGSDVLDGAQFGGFGIISIHTPLAGSDEKTPRTALMAF